MNQIKSVLLPGSFFEDDYVNKTKYLLSNEIDTIYLFDHSINPVSRDLGIYDLVDGVVEAWSQTCSTQEVLVKLEAAGIPSSAIPDIHALKKSPQLHARGMVMPLLHPTIGPLPGLAAAGFPIKFSDAETGYDGPAVRAGQHNNEIFGTLLGIIDEDMYRLKDAGTI